MEGVKLKLKPDLVLTHPFPLDWAITRKMANHATVDEKVVLGEQYLHQVVVYEMPRGEWRGHKPQWGDRLHRFEMTKAVKELLLEVGVTKETHTIKVFRGMGQMADQPGPLVYVRGN